jgi:hypothetical protein
MHSSRRLFVTDVGAAMLTARLEDLTAAPGGSGQRLVERQGEPVSEAAVRSVVVAELGLIVELWHEVRAAGLPVDRRRVADVAGSLERLDGQDASGDERQELTRTLARARQLLDPTSASAI